ncbi:MAG TPA: hypothetical protein VES97_00180 [Solirubrobacteraceae bacterium]|nr:hypothetical protein [Solirubrobacteraceae bacterium]
MSGSSTIFQSSDLNRRGRDVLDAAREGIARIRDTDGASLVLTREESLEAMRLQLDAMRQLAEAMASFITLDRALDHEHREPKLSELGSWMWMRRLPAEDATEFLRDIGDALYESCRTMSAAPLAVVVDAWKATAEALDDPLARETLLGASTPEDYVEAKRPQTTAEEHHTGAAA